MDAWLRSAPVMIFPFPEKIGCSAPLGSAHFFTQKKLMLRSARLRSFFLQKKLKYFI
jgi:hypothetical protein